MTRVCVGGLGYAGFPLALLLSDAGHDVVGYDIDEAKLDTLRDGTDPFGEFGDRAVRDASVTYRSDPGCVGTCEFVLIATPTPITNDDSPELSSVRNIGRDIGAHLREGTTVVLESTIFPGGTRDVLVPAITESSSLIPETEFRIGYSAERVAPGQPLDALRETVKVVGAQDPTTVEELASLYGSVFETIHRAPTIETAEAAKCLENTQRDVNIALINEFAMASSDVDGLDYDAVLDAAETKWNFYRYEPGLVGGHCVPVDPYYLIHRLEQTGRSTPLMRTARTVNRRMADHVSALVLNALDRRQRELHGTADAVAGEDGSVSTDGGEREQDSVLVAGLTYKPNSKDVRSRPIRTVVDRLYDAGLDIVGYDPYADDETLAARLDIPVQADLSLAGFTAMVVLTPHDAFESFHVDDLRERMAPMPVFVDLKGIIDGGDIDDDYIYQQI